MYDNRTMKVFEMLFSHANYIVLARDLADALKLINRNYDDLIKFKSHLMDKEAIVFVNMTEKPIHYHGNRQDKYNYKDRI